MAEVSPGRAGAVRAVVLWDVLRDALAERVATTGRSVLDVLDAGGGTGGFAVPLAELGHRVTVVDSSPDALAGLQRRAAEAGVGVHAVQGDADGLPDVVGVDSADLVLCHSVLEYVDVPAEAMVSIASTLRPGAAVSVLAAGQLATVLHRALAGHLEGARRALEDADDGRSGTRVPRRFVRADLTALVERAGLRVSGVHGIHVFADLVSGDIDAEPAATEMRTLERAAATHSVFGDLAGQLHVLARRDAGGAGGGSDR